ncbi:MAG: ATP-dependent DNA helicase [Desulfomonile tiedjei]|nr:ATP-dependent DNA helicase [Desulfomonile tiedjei]
MDHAKKIRAILGPSGILASSMTGYEHREQQVRMAIEVFEALVSEDRLVIEAPTGTGKTLAYLVAASLSRKKVAISTGTKNLQEQLFYKDIPFVRERIFPELKAALLKGRGNFVCHARMRTYLRQPHLQGFVGSQSVEQILKWYRDTRKTGQGDRAELHNLPDDDPVWMEICSTSESCLGKACSDRDECFVHKMRSKAAAADLMIVNHHLLASDLAVKESGFGEVIPRYEALIADEAHGLEDAATQHFGFHVSYHRLSRLFRDVRTELGPRGPKSAKFQTLLADGEDLIRRLFRKFQDVTTPTNVLNLIDAELIEIRDALCSNLAVFASMVPNLPEVSEELEGLTHRAVDLRGELETIITEQPTGDYACWVERRDRNPVLHASPVEVGGMFRSRLYEKVPSIAFTSATLSSGGTFDYFKSRLGLDGDPQPSETILDSPFDFAAQTMLYIPRSIPEPNAPGFTDALAGILQEVLAATHGRAFVLFTSYRNMEIVYGKLEGVVPFPLLLQGSRPKGKLLSEFRERKGAVLFATSSFWEGVDVQGEALSCVIIDRLPFSPPNDPIVAARTERIRRQGGDPFYSFQVPMAVLALKQGLGRLIRTRSDRGVLCILDIRILTKPYGRVFRASLHDSPLSRDHQAIDEFFSTDHSDCQN